VTKDPFKILIDKFKIEDKIHDSYGVEIEHLILLRQERKEAEDLLNSSMANTTARSGSTDDEPKIVRVTDLVSEQPEKMFEWSE